MSLPAQTLPSQPAVADPGFALYVHWPFCESKCPYCDFNSHVRETIDQARWRRALLRELEHYAALTPGRVLTSLFFGGGTPSLMAPETVAAVIARAEALWGLAADCEITLEANPGSAEAGRFAAYRQAGVNRLCLGVQSLDDAELRFLGRRHDAAEARAAIALAARHFPRWSFDLIYALPEQSPAAWRARLDEALALGPGHLSLYQLTIEPGTAFEGAVRRGGLRPADEAAGAGHFETTQEVMERAGLPAYEVSNHARPGEACRHNLTTWRYGDYLGVGPGAHGRVTLGGGKRATRQHRAPEPWLALVEAQGHATRTCEVLDAKQRLDELMAMGLRLSEGVARSTFERELGEAPEALFEPARLEALIDAGYLVLDSEALRATAAGRLRLDALLGHLLSGRP